MTKYTKIIIQKSFKIEKYIKFKKYIILNLYLNQEIANIIYRIVKKNEDPREIYVVKNNSLVTSYNMKEGNKLGIHPHESILSIIDKIIE